MMLVNVLLVIAVCLPVCDCTAHLPAHNVTHVNHSEVLRSQRLHRRQAHLPSHNVIHVNHSEVLRSHRLRRESGPRPLTPQQKTKALYLHNIARAKEKAADMKLLTWNENLAKLAAEWAAECNFTHDMAKENNEYTWKRYFTYKPMQNLYATANEPFSLIRAIITGWYEEKKDYNYITAKCEPKNPKDKCGHYTAMVWANVSEVGCDAHYCNPFVGNEQGFQSGFYLVCHYYSPGNQRYREDNGTIFNLKPYQKGPVCSKCGSGKAWCRQGGLCNSECTGPGPDCECKAICHNCGTLDEESCSCKCPPGFMGADCSEICENKYHKCKNISQWQESGWHSHQCHNEVYSPAVQALCPLTCEQCEEDKSAEPGLCEPVIYTRPTDDPRLTDDPQGTLPGNTTDILLNDTDPRNSSETSDASTSKLTTMTTTILLMTTIVLAISHHSAL